MLGRRSPMLALALIAMAACGGDDTVESDAERFCGEAIAQQAMIVDPPLETEAQLDATLEFYRLMGQLAPLQITEEWGDLVHALETASTVVPGDPDSEQLAAATAYATERSAFEVQQWLETNCALTLPITTIAPQADTPARTTTIPDGEETTTPDE